MQAATLGVIAFLHLVLAVFVWRAKPQNRVNRLFAAHTLTFVGWTTGIAWVQTGIAVETGAKLAFASAALIAPTLLMFTIHYPDAKRTSWVFLQRVALFAGGLFALAALATEWIAHDVRSDASGITREPGALYLSFSVYFIVVLASGLALFVRKWRSARERERTQLNYYGVGLLVAAVGGITANLIVPALTGSSNLSHLGPYFGLVLITLTAHAIVRHRFMDLRIIMHRSLTIAIAMIFSLVPVVILLLLTRRSIFMRLTALEALVTGGAFLAVALLIPLTGDLAGRLIDRYIYRARTNPQRLLRTASTELTRALDLRRLLDVIAKTIRATAEPHGIAIYLHHGDSLRLVATEIYGEAERVSAPPTPATGVVTEATARLTPLLRDELDAPADAALREILTRTGWALTLPLFADHNLIGLIAVGSKRSGDPYFSEDVDALATLANHAGSAVRNARLYAQVVVANEYLNHIVSAMQNGVVAIDVYGVVTIINPAACELLGLKSADPDVKTDSLPSPLRSILEAVLSRDQASITQEISFSEAGMPQRLLLCTASCLRDHAGDAAGAVVVFSDLTPLKELDKQRARAESLAGLQRVTEALAHEIGNPLVPIKTLTMLLPQRVGDRAFAEKVSRIVPREIERIERLVARLRRVAPTGQFTHSVVDLRVPLRHAVEVIEAAAAEQETQIDIALPADPTLVVGDSAEIEELFLNLLTNALEAVAGQPHPRSIEITVSTDNGQAIAHIEDSGPGIAANLAERIFDPFVTTKSRGSGLGLAICSGIVDRHRGRLTVANGDRGGAIFTVTLQQVAA